MSRPSGSLALGRTALCGAVIVLAAILGTTQPQMTVAADRGPLAAWSAAPGVSATASGSPSPATQTAAPLLGAYYYSWYPANLANGTLGSDLVPPAGLPASYNSGDPTTAAQAISQATSAGINFFALDWWPGETALDDSISTGFLAARNLNQTHFAILYETQALSSDVPTSTDTPMTPAATSELVANMVSIATSYFDNPQYLRINGRPVIFWYLTRTMTGDVPGAVSAVRAALAQLGYDVYIVGDEIYWLTVTESGAATAAPQVDRARLFDAITWYNLYSAQRAGYGSQSGFLTAASQLVQTYRQALGGSVPIVASVIPGFNDRVTRPLERHPAIPQQWSPGAPTGSFLQHMFNDLALGNVDSRAPMVMITSWNEFNEQTAIAPVQATPTTTVDNSASGSFYTQDYQYGGAGDDDLNVVSQVAAQRALVPAQSWPFNAG